jgi:DNA-3-methyladenine glycosylase
MPDPLPVSFFARPTLEVARDLIGQIVVRRGQDGLVRSHQIVEVEAYTQDDPACHAFRGPTKRAGILFGPPGIAYVYFIYGMYHCLNAVTEQDGVAGAVLIRGLRGEKLNGPGKLCRELDIDRSHNGLPLFDNASPVYFARGEGADLLEVETTPRIGISKAQDRLWRYIVKDEPGAKNQRKIQKKSTKNPKK